MTVLQLTLKLVLFIAVGFVARKLKVIADGFDKMLSRFLMALPLPCMIINSFHIEYSVDYLLNAPILIGLSVGSMVFMFCLVSLCTIKMKDRELRKTVRFTLLFTNFTFVGLPVVGELFGAEGVFNYVLFTLPIRVMVYGGAAVMLGKGGERVNVKETIKKFICEPVVAVFIGFFLYAARIELPAVLQSTITSLGGMASPMGLLLCGVIIADADLKAILHHPEAIIVSLCRLIAVPIAALGLFLLLGVEHARIQNMMYFFALPVASFTPTFLLRYNPDAVEARVTAGYIVVVSTMLCVLTIPAWTMVLDRIL